MKSKTINCPYCGWPYTFEVPSKKGNTKYACNKCPEIFVIAWDYINVNYLGTFKLHDQNKNPILIDSDKSPQKIFSFSTPLGKHYFNEKWFTHKEEERIEVPSHYIDYQSESQKAPESSFQIRSISGGVNYDFKGEIGMTGLNGPFIAKRMEVCCNTRNASVTFFSYRNAKKAPVEIHGKIEDLKYLFEHILTELHGKDMVNKVIHKDPEPQRKLQACCDDPRCKLNGGDTPYNCYLLQGK